jgi:hypothetical protein
MPQTVVTTLSQRLILTSITDVEVTDIVDDGAGGFVRAIKVFGQGVIDTQKPLVLEIVIQSDDRTKIKITTPEIDF